MKEVKRLEEALKSAKASVGTAASEALQAAKAAQAGKAEKLASKTINFWPKLSYLCTVVITEFLIHSLFE